MAQSVVSCNLCENPVKYHCNQCEISICDGCIPTHMNLNTSVKHDFVIFSSKKSEVRRPFCSSHSGIKCDFLCRQCKHAVCSKCVASFHKMHHFLEISDAYASLRKDIQQETVEMETCIVKKYEQLTAEIRRNLGKIRKEYSALKRAISDRGKLWHLEIENTVAQFIKNVEKMAQEDLQALDNQLKDAEKILAEVKSALEINKGILDSCDTVQFINHKSRNEEFSRFPAKYDLQPPHFRPFKIDGERLLQQFGTLTCAIKREISLQKKTSSENVSSLVSLSEKLDRDEARTLVTTVLTERDIDCMTSLNNGQMWIGREDGSITRYDLKGNKLERIRTLSRSIPWDLTTQGGHLVFTDGRDKTVNLVKRGGIETIIKTEDWIPSGICSTSTGHLLVCLMKVKNHKVVRYSGFKAKQKIQFNNDGKPLFESGYNSLHIAENRDQNICISDPNASAVTVLNHAGGLLFRYQGDLASKKYKSFHPQSIATDSHCDILVTDVDNNCIHVIDRYGKFLKYIEKSHLNRPNYISIDANDQLFVSDDSSVRIINLIHESDRRSMVTPL